MGKPVSLSNVNTEREINHFLQLWKNRPPFKGENTAEVWDERADEWEDEYAQKDHISSIRVSDRVRVTSEHLRSRGLLGADDEVIDIGCGPGRFVAEFAKTANHATGTDFSSRMLAIGEEYTQSLGLTNTSFVTTDFKTVDIRKQGWEKAFDLCFCSITPAVDSWEDIVKMEEMSRGYCFSSRFVHSEDSLIDAFIKEKMPGALSTKDWSGQTSYTLFNLLWLNHKFPEMTYYKDERDLLLPIDDTLTEKMLRHLPPDERATRQAVLSFLEEKADPDGKIHYHTAKWFSYILWKV